MLKRSFPSGGFDMRLQMCVLLKLYVSRHLTLDKNVNKKKALRQEFSSRKETLDHHTSIHLNQIDIKFLAHREKSEVATG